MNKHSPTGKRRRAASRAQIIAPSYESPDQFARRVGASRSTIWRMMRDGRLRWIRVGTRLRRIPTSEYERLGLLEATKAEEK
jgi:excisionase family DNA binding protein